MTAAAGEQAISASRGSATTRTSAARIASVTASTTIGSACSSIKAIYTIAADTGIANITANTRDT
ncbi:MAG: hypothetical protein RLZZ09_939 [Pseudomonadota bacterium]|jgi:hypothetical protein